MDSSHVSQYVLSTSIFTVKLLAMYTRLLPVPSHTFFLFGPRGTGKTTWLQQHFPAAKWFDLVRTEELLRLMRRPEEFRTEIEALLGDHWIVVDEIQKYPTLLNDVQALIATHGNRFRFALTGSSARKLRRMEVNLLAGRALTRSFFPLTGAELEYDFDIDDLLRFGCLPKVRTEPEIAVDILEAYAATYLKEEIQQEALVKDLGSFTRFLDIAALMNGQIVNVAAIARDAAVARPTVQRYFDTLIDTLIGVWLPAWRPRVKVKEVQHAKFYFFDPGVVNALAGRLRDPLDKQDQGFLLETLVLHELRAAMTMRNCGGLLSYWRTPTGTEIDFIWSRAKIAIGIEIKLSTVWKREFGAALKELHAATHLQQCFAVYLGATRLKDGPIEVLPLKTFMQALATGEILP
ncbi:MAG: ATP-binding protein [Deltaproteobacteria bacterium]|nr:ATP-binding protein [Deltaproteobacteria bacterium]